MALRSDQDTYVVRKGVSPNTVSEISSKTKIFATPAGSDSQGIEGRIQVGVISQFDPQESRSIEPIRGIGYGDQIAELIPGVTEPMTLSITRTAQYLANVYQVFGYKGGIDGLVRSLKHHRWPFDVEKETVFSEVVSEKMGDTSNTVDREDGGVDFQALTTLFEGCWFQDWNTSYTSDSALVTENCSMMVSDVYDGQVGHTGSGARNRYFDNGNKQNSVRTTDSLEGRS